MLATFSVKKPYTVFVAVVIVIIFGVVAFTKMVPDLFPKINTPYVMVMTTYPGASPEEVEIEISKPMEQQLATLTNIKNINSVSTANYSLIQMEFSDDVNMDAISVGIREKIDQIKGVLPEKSGTPVVMKINLDMVPIVTAAVGMEGKTPGEVSQFTKENLLNSLEGIEGVASVTSMGMVDVSIQITLSQEKIDMINEEISAAIKAQMGGSGMSLGNTNSGGGELIEKGRDAIAEGQQQATEQLSAAKGRLNQSRAELMKVKEQGSELEELLEKYGNPETREEARKDIEAKGMTVDEAAAIVAQYQTVDEQIAAVDEALERISQQEESLSVQIGTQEEGMKEAQATIEETVDRLQGSLAQLQSMQMAALSSADMTGILTMKNVSAILSAQNFSMPAGYISDGKAEILVSVGDKIKSKEELENLILFDLGVEGKEPVRLSDIATVVYNSQSADTYAKINGQNGVLLSFTKQSSYATAEVSENILDKFRSLEKKYEELSFITLSDQGEYIHIVINSVLESLLLGGILAIIILMVFLRDIRPTVITAVSIPISVIFAIVLMYFSGVSINMISLAGLAIGVGMLVDNSIVVIENIYRLRTLGYNNIQAAVSGASQVAGAITASTLTTVCVFVPIVFIEGMTKDIFVDLALTVAYSLLASLIIALTLVPALSRGMLKKETKQSILHQESATVKKYEALVGWSLYHKKWILAAAAVLMVISTVLMVSRGFSYMPSMSTPQISATVQMPDDSTLEETAGVTDKLVKELEKVDGVETVGAMLASDTMGMMGMSAAEQDVTSTAIYIVLDEKKAENGRIISKTLEKLASKYGCEISVSADMNMSEMTGGAGIAINLYNDDLDTLRDTAKKVEKELAGFSELEEISDVDKDSTKELHVKVNKNLAMKEGLTVAQVYQQISQKLEKKDTATTLDRDGGGLDVVVENTTSGDFSRKDLESMKLTAEKPDGSKSQVSLDNVAEIYPAASPNAINHDNQKRCIKVTSSIRKGENVTIVTDKVKKTLEKKNIIPSNVRAEYGGENEEIMDAMKQMLLLLGIGFLLVYLIMVAQFQSLRSPFIVIFTIPLAFTGGLLALLITGNEISVVSMMGFVMLTGVVVNNAIVLVDSINRFRLEGMEMNQAIVMAATVRIRPVLMTAVTTVLGLLPLALGMGTGVEMIQPVAITCIGGLMYATVMTLVIIPVMYRMLGKKHIEKITQENLEIVKA